ncbi:biopolymer transporter ExbD [Brevundimonas sp.]|uniref:ExbD/TolR family protein n=1 Tax=Brevundimonas sp. TaxID=1871086 RepID=UPI002EDB0F1D
MAMGGTGGAGGHVRGRRRARKRPLSEINITPLVDVMLVLLIIFMISAPLLSVAVPVEMPKTEANAVDSVSEPVVVTVQQNGEIFVGETAVAWDDLVASVSEAGGPGARDKPISIRGDGRAPYQAVIRVMARLSTAGFTKLNLLTNTAASSGEEG